MMEIEKSYCLCGSHYDPNVFMIQCDICKDWFHSRCTGFQEQTAPELEHYHCPRCTPEYGPSQYKPYRNYHRHEYWDDNASFKPVQTGTATFVKELRARHFHSEADVVVHLKGHMLTEAYLMQHGFDVPIVVASKEGLEMNVPPSDFTLYDVEQHVGGEHEMDVIDVVRQMDVRMKLSDFVRYYYSLNRTKVYNVVSLEFSKTGLSKLVDAPLAARRLDWANVVWPKEYAFDQLCVQKYCLMSVKDSYTDFHIDFGGTSVWYHVLRGQKIFYLIRPTPANLTLYQQWMSSTNQSETFFGDQVDQCFRCALNAGQTMMIPTGWIHAVLTPEDSLVFGGNFLNSLNISMQLQIYDIEKKVKTALKFLYPYFETMHWFAAQKMLIQLQKINSEGGKCPDVLLAGLKTLVTYLRSWNTTTDKEMNAASKEQIPFGMSVAKLFKDISKEVRTAERLINTLNPPKPERESKRARKRPINKDFVDFPFRKTSLDFLEKSEVLPQKTTKSMPKKAKTKPLPEKKATFIAPPLPPPPLETATAVHRGGAVLKIKLGNQETLRVVDQQTLNLHQPKSVYDFKDDDSMDDSLGLFIDESPTPTPPPPKKKIAKQQQQQMIVANWTQKMDLVDKDNPANGIESLLKASALTTKFVDANTQGRTSPSTQEAIAGMLSIGQTFVQPKKSKNRRRTNESNLLEEEVVHVHQDDDYIYPSIDDDEIYNPIALDEAWNPKARVGPLLPKMNRPAREGTKKEAVEKVLEAAARRAPSAGSRVKRNRNRRKPKPIKVVEVQMPLALAAPMPPVAAPGGSSTQLPLTVITPTAPTPGPSMPAHAPPVVQPSTPTTQLSSTPKSKKGMKTAKQRLGKILKLHKMMH